MNKENRVDLSNTLELNCKFLYRVPLSLKCFLSLCYSRRWSDLDLIFIIRLMIIIRLKLFSICYNTEVELNESASFESNFQTFIKVEKYIIDA